MLLPKDVVRIDVVSFKVSDWISGIVFMLLLIQGLYFSKMKDQLIE